MNLFWLTASTFVGWTLAMHAHAFSGGNCSPQGATTINIAPIIAPSNPQAGQVIGLPEGYPLNAPGAVMQCRYDFWSGFHWVTATINAVNANATGRTFNANGVTMPVFATESWLRRCRPIGRITAQGEVSQASCLGPAGTVIPGGHGRGDFTWDCVHAHCRALQGAKYRYLSPWVSSGQYAGAGH
jgi:hypothetical protein